MKQLTEKQAIALYQSGEWKDWTDAEIVKFQLFQERTSLPFDRYHAAIEAVLGRPVWTHEFGWPDNLISEYLGEKPAPSFDDIISMIPPDKLIILGIEKDTHD